MIERFLDIFFSGLAILAFSPFMIVVAVILKLTGEGEVFFFQERMGKNGQSFKLIKFVTMVKDSPNIGTGTVTIKEDPRVLPFGKFLRRTKINQLPQLLNIFFGDMSVIGPRPLTPQTFNYYASETQNIISKVRPGLSGIGSIVFRGEEEIMEGTSASVDFYNNVIAPYKGSLEEWFVVNKNLSIYFKLIFATVIIVLKPNTKIIWKMFNNLPKPPAELTKNINFRL